MTSVLKEKGHCVDVFIEGLHDDIVSDICSFKPDLIGFTCITGDHRWVEKRSFQLKERVNVPIIVGGPHPTYFPEMIKMKGVDIICRGDGETVIAELTDKLDNGDDIGNISGLWVKQGDTVYENKLAPLVDDLDALPFPDRDIYQKYDFFKSDTELPICVSRGCPFDCNFCYNASKKRLYKGQKIVRIRSVENIMTEIRLLLAQKPTLSSVLFNDDNFGLNIPWFDKFCEQYAQFNGPPFFASIRADFITEKRVEQLKKANCFCLSIGVESGDAGLRAKILKKSIPDQKYIDAARLIKKHNIRLRTSNMCFLPEETIENSLKTVDLNRKMKVDYPWMYPLQPYPKTEIYQYAVEQGFLDSSFSFDDIDPLGLLESPLEAKLEDGKKIKVLHRLFYYSIRVPGFRYLLKFLVHVPNNILFELLYRVALLMTYAGYHQVGIMRALKISLQAQQLEKRKNWQTQ